MTIRRIQVENYLCYHDTNTFEFEEGLNIILGENGEGKTKFFEAVDWLLNGTNVNLHLLVSAKKLNEIDIGDTFRVRVSMTVDHYGDKCSILKSFIAKKVADSECTTSNFIIEGVTENQSGERTSEDGKNLLDRIFPFQIRKYSMFKGESELDIFKSESALASLIKLFSDAKHFDKYSAFGASLRERADKAVEDTAKLDKKNQDLYTKLEVDIRELERQRNDLGVHLSATKQEISKIESNIRGIERHVKNAEVLEGLNIRIREIQEKKAAFAARIDENYTTALFDDKWILVNFEPFLHGFVEKIAALSRNKRELQSQHDKLIGIHEGEDKARKELIKSVLPLPDNVPSKAVMEEMLEDEICKVCNREAKKGSEAYDFMMMRLRNYLEMQVAEGRGHINHEELFKHNYANRLESLKINHEDDLVNLRKIRLRITERFEFNKKRQDDLVELNGQLEAEISEREKLLGSSIIGEDRLGDILKNYLPWQKDLQERLREEANLASKIEQLEAELNARRVSKDKIDTSSASSFLIRTRNILRDVERVFIDTQENKFNEFIQELQLKSNKYFQTINIDSFTGTIAFSRPSRNNRNRVDVELLEEGRPFHSPNQSLLTSMHISILFAIAELATEVREDSFPMIFDAPTSSFGENKTAQFLNLICETRNQKILLIKDFLQTDKNSRELSVKREFMDVRFNKAFWVRLDRPFDPNNLKTIKTKVISL
jgi:DNA sulfur modification protein DndD